MKKIERIALWAFSLLLIFTGVISIIFQTFGQGGKVGLSIPPIRGPLAVVFGAAFVAFGGYFVYLLSRSPAEERKRGHAEERTQPKEITRGK